jgi:hypothetical protein
MKSFRTRKIAVLGLALAAALTPAAALADGYYYFNDGNGNCGYISCGAYGCQVVDTFPCPREVSPN